MELKNLFLPCPSLYFELDVVSHFRNKWSDPYLCFIFSHPFSYRYVLLDQSEAGGARVGCWLSQEDQINLSFKVQI